MLAFSPQLLTNTLLCKENISQGHNIRVIKFILDSLRDINHFPWVISMPITVSESRKKKLKGFS